MDLPDSPFRSVHAGEHGLSRRDLKELLESGLLRRPLRGVYCPADLPDTLEVRAACAALVLPAHVVLVDRTAAWLYGVDCLRHAETRLAPHLEVVSVRASRTRRDGIYGGQRELRPAEVRRVHSVRATTPVRTAVDLACLRGGAGALAAVEAFMRACGVTTEDLLRQLPRHRGRRGVVQARQVVSVASSASASAGESWTKWCILDAGLPEPVQQWEVELEGWGRVFLDFAYPELLIAVEYDGREFHGPADQRRDEARRAALREAGWLVIVVRAEGLEARAREAWLGALGSAISEGAPRFRRTYPPKAATQ